jgi:hypothetical protein
MVMVHMKKPWFQTLLKFDFFGPVAVDLSLPGLGLPVQTVVPAQGQVRMTLP